MIKQINKNDVIVMWDTNNIEDMFSTINAVYALEFFNKQIYIGSCGNLADRIIGHCTHKNSKSKGINPLLEINPCFKVHLIKSFDTIEEARKYEKKLIKKYSNKIYDTLLDNEKNFRKIVRKAMINSVLYEN